MSAASHVAGTLNDLTGNTFYGARGPLMRKWWAGVERGDVRGAGILVALSGLLIDNRTVDDPGSVMTSGRRRVRERDVNSEAVSALGGVKELPSATRSRPEGPPHSSELDNASLVILHESGRGVFTCFRDMSLGWRQPRLCSAVAPP